MWFICVCESTECALCIYLKVQSVVSMCISAAPLAKKIVSLLQSDTVVDRRTESDTVNDRTIGAV